MQKKAAQTINKCEQIPACHQAQEQKGISRRNVSVWSDQVSIPFHQGQLQRDS